MAQEVEKLTEQNPTKAKEINDELQKMDLGTAAKDLPDKCQLIDQRLKEPGSAEKKNRKLNAKIPVTDRDLKYQDCQPSWAARSIALSNSRLSPPKAKVALAAASSNNPHAVATFS